MELEIIIAALTVFCLYAGPALAVTTHSKFLYCKKKVKFQVFTTAFWSICHFGILGVLATDIHQLFDDKTAIRVVLVLYTLMLGLFWFQLVLDTISRFKGKKYINGICLAIACIIFAMTPPIPLMVAMFCIA